ncbi:MAG: hypothetical protein LVQ96_04080 [Thermoplasmatales archaeon]|nr:hypothetical protein [Thermoplasmatales archaeon]MCW6170332.1 hypothetical protein [Thermoplasmatales archaeon]
MINTISFYDRNSFDSVNDIIVRDTEELLRTMNIMKMTSPQMASVQFENTLLNFYINAEEKAYEEKIRNLSKFIKFNSLTEQERFLSKNTFLIDILDDAITKIRELFTNERLELAIESDPEIQNDSDILVLKIHTKKNPKEMIKLLNRLDKEWWLETKLKTKQKLIIEEEYD